ncbi:MAG TPA: histidine phosphatase family protein [Bryobacteraceae bacterium]|nr:histidine phosphatase family protein [Bryobacteraceae bacterium]
MGRVYLVRHGQAGTRESYDSLSDVGRRQARLLGEFFVSERLQFAAAYSGELTRQQQTAAEVRSVYREAAMCFPEITREPGWNEFDLAHVYSGLAPQLCAEDPEFAREYEELVARARAAAEDPGASVNRRWLPCDVKIVQAWIRGQHPYDGESWLAFRERVTRSKLYGEPADPDANVVVFTSATPIGIWTALAMEIQDGRALRLAGALHNASYTVLRFNNGEPRLHSFNAIPHLCDPSLRTYR